MKFSYGLSAALIGAVIAIAQPQMALSQTADDQAIGRMAKDVTVVINGQNPGSGAIIAKQGNTYYVLTAKHVVATQDEYDIVTSDAQSHQLDYRTVRKLPGIDLALVQFTSDQKYRVAQLGNSDQITEGASVYTSGWPHPGRAITQRIYQITKGTISGRPLQALEDGYGLVYTNITRSGMSGGPVLDAQGRIIGIHGRAEGEPIFNPDTGTTVDVKSGFNLAIPINTFLKLASQNGMNLSYLDDNFTFANSFADNKKLLSVAISPDGQAIASGLADGTIELWNRNTSKKLRTLNGHSERLNSVVFSPDGTALVSGSEDGTIKIWNLRTGQLTHSLQGDIGFVRSIAISPTSQTLAASGSADINNIKIWNLRTGELVSTLKGHPNFVNAVAFSADGKTLVSGSSDNTIKIWNLDTCKGTQPCSPTQTLAGHSTTVKSIAVSPYEPILASGSYSSQDISNGSDNTGSSEDATIKIWNFSTGELLHTLKGHSRTVTSLAIDPFGHLLASGSYDGTIKIWNLHTGQLLHTLEVRNARGGAVYVFSVAFSTDGQTIISGGDDGTVKIWQVTKRVK